MQGTWVLVSIVEPYRHQTMSGVAIPVIRTSYTPTNRKFFERVDNGSAATDEIGNRRTK